MERMDHRYHHGDLSAALISKGLELARVGGPEAVSLREVTRQVGVSPNAAYRHFTDRKSFLFAVAEQSQKDLAPVIENRMAAADDQPDPARRALLRLRAVGEAYIDFAINEPGWFRLAFASASDPAAPVASRPVSNPPFLLLLTALDDLVAVGILSPAGRRNAEWACWSAVHGFAQLVTAGPLQTQSVAEVRDLGAFVVDVAIHGIIAVPSPDVSMANRVRK